MAHMKHCEKLEPRKGLQERNSFQVMKEVFPFPFIILNGRCCLRVNCALLTL